MVRAITVAGLTACLALAQQFEVASIKPSDAGESAGSGTTTTEGRSSARNVTLRRCVRRAYDL